MNWSRRFKVHLPLSLVAGLTVFVILHLAAWYNLREERNVCRRQSETRMTLRNSTDRIDLFREEQGANPDRLREAWGQADPILDGWGRPFVYRKAAKEVTLYSRGRDGRDGGIGLDADLYPDERNQAIALPTLEQFYTEQDRKEVDRGRFTIAGAIAAFIVMSAVFQTLGEARLTRRELTSAQAVATTCVIVVVAAGIGYLMLPVHIPSGH